MRVAVIGAGPSGLVTLKYLKTAQRFFPAAKPIEVVLFETESTVGGTFSQRAYEDAELVSSKFLTTFSDFRPYENDPDFFSAERYVQYLRDYCDQFDLWRHINLRTPVLAVRRRQGGGHVVHYWKEGDTSSEMTYECDAIAVCTGLHVIPNLPAVPGIDKVPVVKHSADFKRRAEFDNAKTVVILGSGETGIDLAHLAVTSPTQRVVLCHRDGFLGAPKKIPNPIVLPIFRQKTSPHPSELPVDVSWQAPLFDSMYLHPLIRDTLFTWNVYDWGIKATNWLVSGTHHGLDQWVGGISKERYHASKVFFNKAAPKALPYISAPYRPTNPGIVERLRRSLLQVPLEAVPEGRTIDLAPWPTHVDADGVLHFTDNQRPEYARMQALGPTRPDMVVYATGYRQEFPFFRAAASQAPHQRYPVAADADVRFIWCRDDPTIGFIGFVRPGYGAIPPLAELQAQLWLLALLAPERVAGLSPHDEHHYRLRGQGRINYGVDHETYAYQLALDLGAAPSLTTVIRAGWAGSRTHPGLWWRLPIIWAAGAQFNAKFRLTGPYAWDGAAHVLGGELWQTISRRRGLLGNFLLAVLPITVLGLTSLGLYIVGLLLTLLAFLSRPFTWPFRRANCDGSQYRKLEC